ncbi:MAG TPA: hypothetical protein VFA26_21640, partial [Gemmataceae bacterium]|nr:hypothetical protein [Gemmataceae bacterium]
MAAVALLPAALRDKLAAAHRRVRLLRALRGVSLLLLTAVLSAGAAMLLDALVPLPSAVRVVLLAGWLLLNTAVALFGLLLPLGRRIDHDALAALVEERYPDLGERLTTAVELGDQPDLYHGSPALIALLIRETETRTGRLDFLAAVPTGLTLGVGIAAVVAVLLPVVPAVKNPGAFGRQAARFLLPWRGAPTSVPYAVEVLPGDAFAARGRPLTIIARAVPLADNAALPRTATLVQAKEDGTTTRLPMLASGEEFSFKVDNVAGNFRYRVEAGAARSDTHEITAVEPINVAGGSPAVTITPPGYARPAFEPQQLQGFHDVSALQHSKVRLEFRFTQPAKKAVLSWPGKAEKDGKAAAREH